MKELQELAGTLLSSGAASVVIGWEEGPRGARPAFITNAADVGRLIFDHRCTHNLATYLSPRRAHVARLGKPAIVVKGCDARAVAGLLRETQIKREDVVIIGVRCGGVVADPASTEPLTADNVAERCPGCTLREPRLADHVIGEVKPDPPGVPARDKRIAELDAMSPAERWAFWQNEFARCIRCNACREVCPMCFCERCVADKTQPQWLDSSPHPRGNFAWHVTRALHQAGRCSDCGECARACPADIPLGLLNRKIAMIVAGRFEYSVTDDPSVPAPIGAFSLSDRQEFIL
jgi:ferredoxin